MSESEKLKPRFSIIVPVYNSKDHIEKCINSILNQTFGRENIEVVIVDDGSVDGTSEICENFALRYPESVVYKKQENAGVSVARNAGLDLASGEYIGFVDSDDYISSTFLEKIDAFINNCSENVHVITAPVQNFGARNDMHYAHKKFAGGTRVISLNRPQWFSVCPRVAPAIIPAHIAKQHRFDESVTYFEDTKYVTEILSENMLLGVVTGCKYFYRRFPQDSASACLSTAPEEEVIENQTPESSEENALPQNEISADIEANDTEESIEPASLTTSATAAKAFYLDTPRKVSLAILESNADEDGHVPTYFQYVALGEMRWRTFYNVSSESDVLAPEEIEEYAELNKRILSYIDDESIFKYTLCNNWQRVYLLCLKYDRNIFDELHYDETGALVWNNHVVFYAPTQFKVNLINYCIRDGMLLLRAMCLGFVNDELDFYIKCGDERHDVIFEEEDVLATQFSLFRSEFAYARKTFLASIPLPKETTDIKFYFKAAGREYPVKEIGLSSLESKNLVRPIFKRGDGFIVRRFKNRLTSREDTLENRMRIRLSQTKRNSISKAKRIEKKIAKRIKRK